MHGSDSRKLSRQSSPDSRSRGHSRERYRTPERSQHSRHHRHKSGRDRSRFRNARNDNYRRRSSSRSRSKSSYHTVRQNDSRRYESSSHTKNVPADLKLITHDACYFLLKSNNFDNLLLAKAESVWSTPPQNEVQINNAFKVCQ